MTATRDMLELADRARLRVVRRQCETCGAVLEGGLRRWCGARCADPIGEPPYRAPGDGARYLAALRATSRFWA
jgi:hypothetical protein